MEIRRKSCCFVILLQILLPNYAQLPKFLILPKRVLTAGNLRDIYKSDVKFHIKKALSINDYQMINSLYGTLYMKRYSDLYKPHKKGKMT